MSAIYEQEEWKIIGKHKSGPSKGKTITLTIKKLESGGSKETSVETKDGITLNANKMFIYSHLAAGVSPDQPSYSLVADTEYPILIGKRKKRVPDTCVVWPREFIVSAVNEKDENFAGFEFTATQGSTDLKPSATDAQGKSTLHLEKNGDAIDIQAKPPYVIIKTVKDKSKLREVKYTARKALIPEFIKPTPTNDGTAHKQFINLTTGASGTDFKGHEVEIEVGVKADLDGKKGFKDDVIYIQAKFGRESGRNSPLPELKDADNIVKTDGDKTQTGSVTLASNDGTKKFKVIQGKAGGETCEIRLSGVKDTFNDQRGPTLKFVTWRKLYFQVTKLSGMIAPNFADAQSAFNLVNIDFEEDVGAAVDVADNQVPAGGLVNGALISAGSPVKTLIVGTQNVNAFKGKFKKTKMPAVHIILCDQQLDCDNNTVYDATFTLDNTDKLKWPPGGGNDVPGWRMPFSQTKVDSALFFAKDLRDGSDSVKLFTWTCVQDNKKTGNVPRDHIVIDPVNHGNFVHIKLPVGAATEITNGNTIRLRMKIAYAKGWYNGWCTNGDNHNVIKIGRPDVDICSTIVHESGHALKQSARAGADASFPGLSAPPHARYYTNNRGHQGSHCADGVTDLYFNNGANRMDSATASGACTCIMYGAGTDVRNANPKFCDRCKPYILAVEATQVSS